MADPADWPIVTCPKGHRVRLMGIGSRAPKLGDTYNCIRCDAWYLVSSVIMDDQGPIDFKHTETGDPRVW